MSDQDLTGDWYFKKPDGDFDVIKVLEINGKVAYAVNKNIAVDDLKKNYYRKEDIAENPFASQRIQPTAEMNVAKPAVVEKAKTESQQMMEDRAKTVDHQASTTAPVQQKENLGGNMIGNITIQDATPEESFVENAIKLSKESSTLDIKLALSFDCNVQKLQSVIDAVGIDPEVLAKVLMAHIKADPTSVFDQIQSMLNREFGVVKIAEAPQSNQLEKIERSISIEDEIVDELLAEELSNSLLNLGGKVDSILNLKKASLERYDETSFDETIRRAGELDNRDDPDDENDIDAPL